MADFFKKQPKDEKRVSEGAPEGGAMPPAPGQPRPPREKKVRQPKPPKPPRAARPAKPPKPPKPPRQPKVKKERPPKGPKKPFFSFGKKKAKEPATGEPEAAMAGAPLAKPTREKKVREPRKPRPPKAAKAPKAPKAARGAKVPGEKKAKPRGGAGKTSPVGLDLGRTSIGAVQLKYQVGGAAMLTAAVDTLPEGLIQEGEVRDVEGLAFAIKEFWKAHHIKGKKVALGLANQKVVVRTLEFPILDEKELKSAIEFQAQDYIPIPIDEAVLDHYVLGRFTDENGIEKQKVLVVAAQKLMVMDFINAIKKARLSVDGMDLQAFAMLRSLSPKSSLDLAPVPEAVAIANISSDVTNLVVEIAGEPQFTRIISYGGDDFTRAVQDLKGITFEEAEEIKTRFGLAIPADRAEEEGAPDMMPPAGPMEPAAGEPPAETPPAGPEPPAETPPAGSEPPAGAQDAESADERTEIERALELAADALSDELRRSLDYYQSQETSAPISRLIISGGGALLANLDRFLSQGFPFRVEMGNPLQRITQNRTGLADDALEALGPRLAIAIGLALEDEE